MSQTKHFDLSIVGGGIAGLTLASALIHRGIKVQVYEAAHHFGEIGAGVAFTSNAIQAMQICAPGVHNAFLKVCTPNGWASHAQVYFDWYDGYGDGKGKINEEKLFSSTARNGMNGCHRAKFLDELVKLVPDNVCHFGKRLEGYAELPGGKLGMHFRDGTTALTDAIIGADGIKSKVREAMFGVNHPCAAPSFTHTCAYRGVVPMEQAIEAIGEEKARNSSLYIGAGGHVLTLPIDQGAAMNIVAFHRSWEPWTDTQHLTKPARREEALHEFASYSEDVKKILMLCKEDLDVWAIFDTGDHPPPSYNKGRTCIHGDAAHATTPHHGSGAGFCIEGSAVFASLINDSRVRTAADLEIVFEVYNAVRRHRTMWLVQSSRFMGEMMDGQKEAVGRDLAKLHAEEAGRYAMINDIDVERLIESALVLLHTKLGEAGNKA